VLLVAGALSFGTVLNFRVADPLAYRGLEFFNLICACNSVD